MPENDAPIPRPVPRHLWGRDHWSTLLYAETRAVDHCGELDRRQMRCDPARHPELDAWADRSPKKHPTLLAGGAELPDHDDWDCLADMEAAGFLTRDNWTKVTITDQGFLIVGDLRKQRARGVKTDDLVPLPVVLI